MNVNRNAPAVASAETFIAAPVELVWNLQADIANWPAWNKAVRSVELHNLLQEGSEFRWVSGGMRIVSRVTEVIPMHRIVWTGRTVGIKAIHAWMFEDKNGGSYVQTEESFEGMIVRVFAASMQRILATSLEQWVLALKEESERHAASVKA